MTADWEKGWFTAATAIVLEGLLLACVMTLPFLLVSGYVAGLLSAGIVLIWWWVRRLMADPDALERQDREKGFWTPEGLLDASAVAAAFGVLALGLAAMMRWGYNDSADPEILGWLRWPGFPIPVLLLAISAVLFVLSLRRWRESARAPSRPANASPDRAFAVAPTWIATFTDLGAAFAYMTVALVTTGFYVIHTTMYDGDGPEILEFLGHSPIIALAIPMAGLMTAARLQITLAARGADSAEFASSRHGTVWRVATVIRLACFPAAVAALVYSFHVINVVISSSLPAMTTALETGKEVYRWVAAQHDEGAAIGSIADRLNRHGLETELTDGNGLFGLLPEPDYRDFGSIRNNRCRVGLQAGIAEPAEVEAVIRRVRKDGPNPSIRPDPNGPLLVTYCVKISCPPLATWEREPMWALYSSHPAERPGWARFFRIRPFFEGQQSTPGGYCMADGSLAESYQG